MSAVAQVGAYGEPTGGRNARPPVPTRAALDVDATAQALAELSAPDRAAVLLIYFYGRTQAEVAHQLGMPPAEVRRRVARALVGLGNRLRVSDASRRVAQAPRSP